MLSNKLNKLANPTTSLSYLIFYTIKVVRK